MRDFLIGRRPDGTLTIFDIESEGWAWKSEHPKAKLYRYAFVGEAAPYKTALSSGASGGSDG